MICVYMESDKRDKGLLVVLEPANLEKIKLGLPIVKNLREFIPDMEPPVELIIAYTPDAFFVSEQLDAGVPLDLALHKALKRQPVIRDPQEAEDLAEGEKTGDE